MNRKKIISVKNNQLFYKYLFSFYYEKIFYIISSGRSLCGSCISKRFCVALFHQSSIYEQS